MTTRKPTAAETAILLLFHAIISGAFFVAYLTGDEDTYGIHVFSGYAVLGAVALRLLIGLAVPSANPLRLRWPNPRTSLDYLRRFVSKDVSARQERSPLYAWIAIAILAAAGLAAASGAIADFVVPLEDMHEALGELALWIALAHIAIVLALHVLKRAARLTRASARRQGVKALAP